MQQEYTICLRMFALFKYLEGLLYIYPTDRPNTDGLISELETLIQVDFG